MELDQETAKKLWMHIAKTQVYHNGLRERDIQLDANYCQNVLGRVFDVTVKTIRICTKFKLWWNGNIIATWRTLRQEMRWYGQHLEGAAATNAELQKSVQTSKSRMWIIHLHNLLGDDVEKAAPYIDPQTDLTVEELLESNSNQINTAAETVQMLRIKSVPSNWSRPVLQASTPQQRIFRSYRQSVE